MENSFFLFTSNDIQVNIDRFHTCIWEFDNDSSLIEFGFEINKESVKSLNAITISLYIPWLKTTCVIEDLFPRLRDSNNSRFIFNDSISNTEYIANNTSDLGVTHVFSDRNRLCVLPTKTKKKDKILDILIDLSKYQALSHDKKANIYCRVSIKPTVAHISTQKAGIGKNTIIYDIKVNERRNIPLGEVEAFTDINMCKISSCFLFNIVPNKYDIVFFESGNLKNVRTLEHDSFKEYLKDDRIKKDELIVVFSKKTAPQGSFESFTFFSIFSKETIGATQFMVAIFLNILCGLLFFIASFRHPPATSVTSFFHILWDLPGEIYAAFGVTIVLSLYLFLLPILKKKFINWKPRLKFNLH